MYGRVRVFFDQEEDGIGEFCLSRGLGNVCKRQEEYLAAPTPMADFADTDGDGGVTQEEFAAFVQAAKAKRK